MSRQDASKLDQPRNGLDSFVDTHCHLDGSDFVLDLPEVLARATALGVERWINVGYSPTRWQSSIDMAAKYPGMSYMLGVHPGHTEEWSPAVESQLRRLVEKHKPVAIGEIGLDFFRGETNVDQQVDAFRTQLQIAREFEIPAAIHMRNAEPLMIDILSRELNLPSVLFHSFDGSSALTDWVVDRQAWIGVGGLATRSKSAGLREQIARVSLDRIVLETDSPYLVPNGFKHRRNTPESIPIIARVVADLFGITPAEVAIQTTRNSEQLFRRLPI